MTNGHFFLLYIRVYIINVCDTHTKGKKTFQPFVGGGCREEGAKCRRERIFFASQALATRVYATLKLILMRDRK